MYWHPDKCEGAHEPVRNEINPQGRCGNCGTVEVEAWAHGEQLWRHMHDYSLDERNVMRCDCGAWLPKSWHDGKLEDGRQIRAKRLERLAESVA